MKRIGDKDRFKLVYMDADVEYCRKNDKYGLYKLADEGKLNHLAGVDEKYDIPEEPDIVINSNTQNKEIDKVVEVIA